MDMLTIGLIGGAGVLAAVGLLVAVTLRRVVSTNEVHIVQSSKKTTSYGKDTGNGNTYYEWPSFLPVIGITKIEMPVSNFNIDLKDYVAYDEGRLPFEVDITAFFRIADANIAAQRVSHFDELKSQLKTIVEGAARKVLASNTIDEIMKGRGQFGEQFTNEVQEQLKNWGVETVKNIELMDIRDGQGSNVIKNIMDKKKSEIEKDSRIEVAKNSQAAQIAEIEAKRQTDLSAEEAKQQVGLRQVEVERQLSMENEKASQQVKEQAKLTKEKEMAVVQVEATRKAEIAKQVALVQAEQSKQTSVISAQAAQEVVTLKATGDLQAKKMESEGIAAEGKAKADAERAMLLAPVEAQTTLAKEIGQNEPYQKYLISVEQIKAGQAVGIEQAKALQEAEVKVISNTGNPTQGLNGVMDLFSSKGGTELGAMLEGLANTDKGQELLGKFLGATGGKKSNGAGASPLNGKA
ncbi:MAG: hypothetical protein HC840_01000 [Leptolyngbyaceae cyanobacterium RM2_2_4]|nr:hypothetical protein [Leptolyngbyaceae cyanobacterium RM2_2_4]